MVGGVYAYGTAAVIPGALALALTGWSRIHLKEHTFAEATAGAIFGTFIMAVEFAVTMGPPR